MVFACYYITPWWKMTHDLLWLKITALSKV
jgi:hypothetical protein